MQGDWQSVNPRQRPANNSLQKQGEGFLDFNKISELPSKYPRV